MTAQQYKDIEELGILADKDDQVSLHAAFFTVCHHPSARPLRNKHCLNAACFERSLMLFSSRVLVCIYPSLTSSIVWMLPGSIGHHALFECRPDVHPYLSNHISCRHTRPGLRRRPHRPIPEMAVTRSTEWLDALVDSFLSHSVASQRFTFLPFFQVSGKIQFLSIMLNISKPSSHHGMFPMKAYRGYPVLTVYQQFTRHSWI